MTDKAQLAQAITDAEIEILQTLWDEQPLSAQQIIERLQADAPLSSHPKTVKTLINRLLKKGALGFQERERKYFYYPLIARETFFAHKTSNFLDRFFDGELTPMVSFFSQQKKLDEKDLAELKELIRKLEADNDR
jgi:predicted transcriptional regulator